MPEAVGKLRLPAHSLLASIFGLSRRYKLTVAFSTAQFAKNILSRVA
jgi:hypothetical protein